MALAKINFWKNYFVTVTLYHNLLLRLTPELTMSSLVDEGPTCSGLLACWLFTRVMWLKLVQTFTPA
jgi:hypothetical protein